MFFSRQNLRKCKSCLMWNNICNMKLFLVSIRKDLKLLYSSLEGLILIGQLHHSGGYLWRSLTFMLCSHQYHHLKKTKMDYFSLKIHEIYCVGKTKLLFALTDLVNFCTSMFSLNGWKGCVKWNNWMHIWVLW